ncbi:DUF4156 domain-containing protein [Aureimonas sp. AU12]|uniref:DUF4156 domain-containing protein n=1 Tax=Aureimonas sp. AU12 TaxID=1638161 RepID=UPI000B332D4C|nr:DUF4156 domain-containing protein [Aureimonas sp. AU12]
MKRLIAVMTLLPLAACQTASVESNNVVVTGNPELVRGCQFLGQESGRQYMMGGVMLMGAAQEDANRRLKNKAAEKGATHLLTTNSQMGMGGASATGDLYKCKR